ncbi:hypothetical protein [Cryobacterium sp. Hz9]|uniref:hypothetical protein n=1 Tax=Cryobacterium sp. Hz9 TaxID=1259167 RepID=UPI001F544049|nr:hypothetical protein [Cryobacterium sp. Hz9]
MATAYQRRPRPHALDIAAVAHNKIGNGSTWHGYYMFAGGRNPRSGLQESQATAYPNDMPVFDYDFHALIEATGRAADNIPSSPHSVTASPKCPRACRTPCLSVSTIARRCAGRCAVMDRAPSSS